MELVEEKKAPKEEKKMGERRVVVDKAYLYDEDKPLTVCKTSLFHTGDGFTAYDCNGDIIFRVDSYGRDNDEFVLMDATGKCLLTVKSKVKNHLINYYIKLIHISSLSGGLYNCKEVLLNAYRFLFLIILNYWSNFDEYYYFWLEKDLKELFWATYNLINWLF